MGPDRPFELRLLLAAKPEALSAMGRIFVQEIQRWQREHARALGYERPETAAVSFCQRFGSSLNLNIHWQAVTYQCETTDQRYRSGELRWRSGQPTPLGPYHCYCPSSEQEVPAAGSCEDAIILACGVDLAAPKNCSVSESPEGACWPVLGSPGSWRCRCGSEDVLT